MTLKELSSIANQARMFWRSNDPFRRMKFVKGIHPLAYGGSYDELTVDEKLKVKAFIRSTAE
jgi:hypothetical protein